MFPNGRRVQRTFLRSGTLADVRAFVEVMFLAMELDIGDDFDLVTNYPKRNFGPEDRDTALSMEDAGLHPQAVLYVKDNEA